MLYLFDNFKMLTQRLFPSQYNEFSSQLEAVKIYEFNLILIPLIFKLETKLQFQFH